MNIYGNQKNMNLIRVMKKNQHLPHACLFTGEKGSGRKTLANYFAMTALCNEENAPCGTCRSCRKILNGVHPDLIPVEHSGKKMGFSIDTVREVCKDAVIAPNDGNKKIYLFSDADAIGIPAQNALLKLTEEPPEHVILLFTCENQHTFLTTMLSRMMLFSVCPCTPGETYQSLLEHGCSPADAQRASQVYRTNIGLALAWLEDPKMQEMTSHASSLTMAVAQRKPYEILRILSLYEKDRLRAAAFLKLMREQFRDALIIKYQADALTGCDRLSAQALSAVLTINRAEQLCQELQSAYEALNANVSVKLVLAALGGNLL